MKLSIQTLICLTLVACAPAQPSLSVGLLIPVEPLSVLSQASEGASLLTTVSAGQSLTLTGVAESPDTYQGQPGRWLSVRVGDQDGFVFDRGQVVEVADPARSGEREVPVVLVPEAARAAWSNASSGLVLRDAPNTGGQKLTTVAWGAQVERLAQANTTESLAGATGSWTLVKVGGQIGWMFGGFLSAHPVLGSLSGEMSYPSEILPAQIVVAFNLDSGQVFRTMTRDQEQFFDLTVPPGRYHVVSYLKTSLNDPETTKGAGYTENAITGGGNATDGGDLITVTVEPGKQVGGIVFDWFTTAVPPFPRP